MNIFNLLSNVYIMKSFSKFSFVLILVHFIINSSASAQASQLVDSSIIAELSKYSYPLVEATEITNITSLPGIKSYSLLQAGTCFFYRKNMRLFLITAYHIMTASDVYQTNENPPNANILGLRYNDTDGITRFYMFNIDSIKQNNPRIYFATSPDIFVYEIKDTLKDAIIYSVEKIVTKKTTNLYQQEVIIFGFSSFLDVLRSPTIQGLNSTLPQIYNGTTIENAELFFPEIKNALKINFITVPATLHGGSGAPVFSIIRNGSKQKKRIKFEFIGVQSGSSPLKNFGVIVRGEQFIKLLEEKIKK